MVNQNEMNAKRQEDRGTDSRGHVQMGKKKPHDGTRSGSEGEVKTGMVGVRWVVREEKTRTRGRGPRGAWSEDGVGCSSGVRTRSIYDIKLVSGLAHHLIAWSYFCMETWHVPDSALTYWPWRKKWRMSQLLHLQWSQI